MKSTKFLLLLIAFIDYMGVGLIYPLFSSMLFDHKFPLVAVETSSALRGFYLGGLLALMPLAQFISAPYWGAISDIKGRKNPLLFSLGIATLGYGVACLGAFFCCLPFLAISRLLIGFASGNTSIVQASLADISDENQKAKNYGLYSMALGTGFTLGPFIGGSLSHFGYSLPFFFALVILSLNLGITAVFLKNTYTPSQNQKLNLTFGLKTLKQTLRHRSLRGTFIASFLYNFGWCYFFEFIPVYLLKFLHFSTLKLGSFYAIAGLFYALSAGLLIRPFIQRFKPLVLFQMGLITTGLVILSMHFIKEGLGLWPVLFLLCFFAAFTTPSATTYISSKSNHAHQGKTLGALSCMNALALIISPLISGSFVGTYPKMPIWLGGSIVVMAAVSSLYFSKKDKNI